MISGEQWYYYPMYPAAKLQNKYILAFYTHMICNKNVKLVRTQTSSEWLIKTLLGHYYLKQQNDRNTHQLIEI
jgi:hypothetical protein